MSATGDQERQALLRLVENFALVLRESGLPPMPARVLAYALADDADRYTASELASGLRVSPAAISGAVRTLVQFGLLRREREPARTTGTGTTRCRQSRQRCRPRTQHLGSWRTRQPEACVEAPCGIGLSFDLPIWPGCRAHNARHSYAQ